MSVNTKLDIATNRLSLGYDVPSMVTLLIEWAKVAAEAYEDDPQEWVKALADEINIQVDVALDVTEAE